MKSLTLGKSTLKAEVVNISAYGIWVYVRDKEYFLPYEDFPWFKNAKVIEIYNVKFSYNHHLHWPDLDVDLELDSFRNLEQYPLIYR